MSLNKKIAVGAFWSVLTRLGVKSLGFVSLLILARLLFPEDFGLIALTMTMVAFFEIFSRFGFDINIIQKDSVTDKTLNSAWTCKIILGLIISYGLIVSSEFIAIFFNEHRLDMLITVAAGIPVLKSLENIGFVLYRKELNLRKEFNLEIISKIVSFCALVSAGFILRSYWALLIGIYVNTVFRVYLSFSMHTYRPSIELSEAKELFNFSKWLLFNNLLIFFNHKVTELILGNKTDSSEVGFYSMSYEISNLPTSELVFPLSRAIFPGYSLVKSDDKKLKTMFLDFTRVVVFFTAPISFGLIAVASDAVDILLGEKWQPIAGVIVFLSLYGFTRSCVQNIGNVFIAKGKPYVPVYISIFRLFLIIPALLYFVPLEGAKGAAFALCAVSFVTLPVSYFICARYLSLSFKDVFGLFFFPVTLAVGMFALVYTLNHSILADLSTLVRLLLGSTVGFLFYTASAELYIRQLPNNDILARARNKVVSKLLLKLGRN